MTKRLEIFERAVMMSSVIPSLKYSCSGSPLMLTNGRTAGGGGEGGRGGRRGSLRRVRRRVPGLEPYPVHPHGLRDVLDGLLAEILVAKPDLALDLIIGRAREADAARLSEAFHPRRYVDSVAVDPLPFDDHIAQVDADAELHPPGLRQFGVPGFEGLLDLRRAQPGVHHARELGEQIVAGGIHHPAPVLG